MGAQVWYTGNASFVLRCRFRLPRALLSQRGRYVSSDARDHWQRNWNKHGSSNIKTEKWGKNTRNINRSGEQLMVPACTFHSMLLHRFCQASFMLASLSQLEKTAYISLFVCVQIDHITSIHNPHSSALASC